LADFCHGIFRAIALQRAMLTSTIATFFSDHFERLEELEILLVTVFHLERPGTAATALQMKFRLELTDRDWLPSSRRGAYQPCQSMRLSRL
jgi:hypothetical protein